METIVSPGSLSRLEDHLGYWLRRVSNHVSGSFARNLHVQQTSVAEWVLMRRLYDCPEATSRQLAEALTMTPGAISKIVDKLEAKGWITGKVLPSDNRARLLSLTRKGLRILPTLAEIADTNDELFFACLESGERETLRRLLRKLVDLHQIHETPVV